MVLGKMQRLGNKLKEQHMKMGNTIMEMGGVDHLITVGSNAALTGNKVIELGMAPTKVSFVDDAEELDSVLENICREDTVILFKMSTGKMKASYREVVKKYCGKSFKELSESSSSSSAYRLANFRTPPYDKSTSIRLSAHRVSFISYGSPGKVVRR